MNGKTNVVGHTAHRPASLSSINYSDQATLGTALTNSRLDRRQVESENRAIGEGPSEVECTKRNILVYDDKLIYCSFPRNFIKCKIDFVKRGFPERYSDEWWCRHVINSRLPRPPPNDRSLVEIINTHPILEIPSVVSFIAPGLLLLGRSSLPYEVVNMVLSYLGHDRRREEGDDADYEESERWYMVDGFITEHAYKYFKSNLSGSNGSWTGTDDVDLNLLGKSLASVNAKLANKMRHSVNPGRGKHNSGKKKSRGRANPAPPTVSDALAKMESVINPMAPPTPPPCNSGGKESTGPALPRPAALPKPVEGKVMDTFSPKIPHVLDVVHVPQNPIHVAAPPAAPQAATPPPCVTPHPADFDFIGPRVRPFCWEPRLTPGLNAFQGLRDHIAVRRANGRVTFTRSVYSPCCDWYVPQPSIRTLTPPVFLVRLLRLYDVRYRVEIGRESIFDLHTEASLRRLSEMCTEKVRHVRSRGLERRVRYSDYYMCRDRYGHWVVADPVTKFGCWVSGLIGDRPGIGPSDGVKGPRNDGKVIIPCAVPAETNTFSKRLWRLVRPVRVALACCANPCGFDNGPLDWLLDGAQGPPSGLDLDVLPTRQVLGTREDMTRRVGYVTGYRGEVDPVIVQHLVETFTSNLDVDTFCLGRMRQVAVGKYAELHGADAHMTDEVLYNTTALAAARLKLMVARSVSFQGLTVERVKTRKW